MGGVGKTALKREPGDGNVRQRSLPQPNSAASAGAGRIAAMFATTIDALARRGHAIDRWDAWNEMAGDAHGITIDRRTGILSGGSDPRSDEAAIGY
jgi:gamma-glutamyltranspeptidase